MNVTTMYLPHDEFNDEWIYHTMNLTTMNLPHDEFNDEWIYHTMNLTTTNEFTTRWI